MSAEDTFTSIQWDRGDESQHPAVSAPSTITEGDDSSDKASSTVNDVTDANSDNDINAKNADDGILDEEEQDSAGELDTDSPDLLIASKKPSNDSDAESNDRLSSGHSQDRSRRSKSVSSRHSTASSNSLHLNSDNDTTLGNHSNAAPDTALPKLEPAVGPGSETAINNVESRDQPNLFYTHTIDSSVNSPIRDLDSVSKPFISYRITTVTNHPSIIKLSSVKPSEPGHAITVHVRRRYGDFRFLHDCLSNDYHSILVPPLPSKSNFKYLTGDTFSTAFVHKRLHSLDRFVKYITNHAILSQSSIFHLFVSDSPDWSTFTKNLKISKTASSTVANDEDPEGSSGFASSVVNKVVNEDLLTETVMNFLTPAKHKRETNKDILEISDKLKKLYENLLKLDKIFTKLNKKNQDLSQDYDQFASQIKKLSVIQGSSTTGATTEPTESNGSNETAPLNDHQQFTNNFKVFAESLSFFSHNWSELHKYIDESFLVSLKDCSKYIISLTNLIELQHNRKIDLQVLQDYLNKTRSELASLGGHNHTSNHSVGPPTGVMTANQSGGFVNNTTQLIKDTLSTSATPHIASSHTDSKVTKLQNKIEQLENEISNQTQLVQDLTNKIINEEYPNWDKFNKQELKQTMVGLCNEEIKFYKGLVDNWSDVEMKLMTRLEELK